MFQLKVILILILAVVLVHSSNTTFRLLISRNQDSNIITLTCRNDQELELQGSRVMFFLNGSELNPQNYPSFRDQNDESDMVTFQINRQLEGMYSCGTEQGRSSHRSLIVYPTSDSFIRRRNHYAVAGETAVLDCAVSPGALIHYYHVMWRNGSRTIFRQSLPSQRNSTFPDSIDPRYRLDPMNLSLIIDDVRRSDSIQDYHCDLHVIDPHNENSYFYRIGSRVNIPLTVLTPPVVTTLRPLQGTVRQRENAIFSCKAEGYPLPTISWMHNGVIVADGHPDYLISPKNEGSSSLRVASNLRIFSASVDKTGDVTCIATVSTPEESRIIFDDHNASTSLTVLGKFQVFDVLISLGGDVIFLLELPAVYNQSVHLFIKYTDDNNSNRSYNRTTEIGFLNSKSIQYVEYSSQVSYDRFRVKAGLVSGGMLGPLTEAPGVYDKDSATLCDDDGIRLHHALVYSVIPAGFFFLLCIVLIIVICVIVYINSQNFKKETHCIENFIRHIFENTEVRQPPIAGDLQPPSSIPSGAQVRAQNNPPPTDDKGEDTAGSSGATSPEQKLGNREFHSRENQQKSQMAQQRATPTPTQRTLSTASVNATGSNSGATSVRDHENRGEDDTDTGVGTPLLAQQQSVVSPKSKSAHRDNPVYYLVKKSMKDAKFPERRYRRLKEKLRSTCEKYKKEQ